MNDLIDFDRGPVPQARRALREDFLTIYEAIAAGASRRDAERAHPFEALDQLRRARFGALLLPVAEGGGGGTLRDVIEQAVLLGEADTNVAHIFRNHFTIVERLLVGSRDERRAGWRLTVLEGGIIGLASTELGGSQTGGAMTFKTRLTPQRDGFRLNGTKFYSTGSLYADLILVRAAAPDGPNVTLVIPAKRDGVELVDDWDGIGQRVTGTGTTKFRDVRVEAAEVIFDADLPSYLLSYTSTIAQLYLTAINAGIVRAVLRDAKAMLGGRGRNFYYAPAANAADDPILQQALGRIAADAFAAELVTLAAADRLDRTAQARVAGVAVAERAHEAALAAAKAKVIVDELVLRSATALFDVGGASATGRDRNLDRHWRNARTLASHNPAGYKAQAIGAFELLGKPLPQLGFF